MAANRPALDELARLLEVPERMDRAEALLRQIDSKLDALLAVTPSSMDSADQAAERHKVTPATIRRWAAAGLLPGAERVGRAWRIPVGAKVTPDDAAIQRLADAARGQS